MKRVSMLFLVSLSLISSAQNAYKNPEYGFEINFPNNWQIKQSGQENTIVNALNPSKDHISYIEIAAYSIPINDLEYYKNVSPVEMFKILKEEGGVGQLELLDSGYRIIDGKKAVWTKVRMTFNGTYHVTTSTYHILINSTFFRITNLTDGGEKLYDELSSTFEKSVNSLKFH